MDFKEQWDLDTALKVIQNETVDSRLWAEAVEWLLLYGPPEIVSILLQASGHATEECFPNLHAAHHTNDGQPCYDLTLLAESLGISEEEVRLILSKKLRSGNPHQFFDNGGSSTIH